MPPRYLTCAMSDITMLAMVATTRQTRENVFIISGKMVPLLNNITRQALVCLELLMDRSAPTQDQGETDLAVGRQPGRGRVEPVYIQGII